MDQGPVYEICDLGLSPKDSCDSKKNVFSQSNSASETSVNKVSKRKISARVCVAGAFAVVALLALLILVGAVLSMAMQQRTNISVPVAVESNAELKLMVENLTEQVNDLKRVQTLTCEVLPPPTNGYISTEAGPNLLTNGLGSRASYFCYYGYALMGYSTRTCQDINGGTATMGEWSRAAPNCTEIYCNPPPVPTYGGVERTSGDMSVNSTISYYCNYNTALVGMITRTCVHTNTYSRIGSWNGTTPLCQGEYNIILNCEDTVCRYKQLMCPDQDNCTIHCNDDRPYACFRNSLICQGNCALNCDDSYACFQTKVTCPQGNCDVLCSSDNSCRYSVTRCSGSNCLQVCNGRDTCLESSVEFSSDNSLLNCEGQQSCSRLNTNCSGEICHYNCTGSQSCSYSTMNCSKSCSLNCTNNNACRNSAIRCLAGASCTVNCQYGYRTCYFANFMCEQDSNCTYIFGEGRYSNYIGQNSDITCEENSTCNIKCTGLSNSARGSCYNSDIICPPSGGHCAVECSGYLSCQYSRITCGPNNNCLTCSGQYSCNSATIRLQTNKPPTLNCIGISSCQSTKFYCPSNKHCYIGCTNTSTCNNAQFNCPTSSSCIINCDGQRSCSSSRVTCPTGSSCTINCDGQYSCNNARVTCPSGSHDCVIRCTDPLSCQNLRITNTHRVSLLCCGGPNACGGTVTPTSTDCPYIN